MWPRKVFLVSAGKPLSLAVRNVLKGPGVYVLYRDDHPHYVGKTSRPLFDRIWNHATQPHDPYYLSWNYFSAFAVQQKTQRGDPATESRDLPAARHDARSSRGPAPAADCSAGRRFATTVVAPTGFESVFTVRPALFQLFPVVVGY
jgi:hypothetical protein